MSRKVIEIVNGVTRHPMYRLSEPIRFELCEGEQMAIIGPNGSGKTLLVNVITGQYPLLLNDVRYDFGEYSHRMVCENMRYMTFRDTYGDHDSNYYYQQRWHSQDVECLPVVRNVIPLADNKETTLLYKDLAIDVLLDKQMVMLSSGELRRLQIVKALLSDPKLLIIDNPFIGLDDDTRSQLTRLLKRLIDERGLQLIFVVSREEDIPEFITHVVPVSDKVVGRKIEKNLFPSECLSGQHDFVPKLRHFSQTATPLSTSDDDSNSVIAFRDVSLRYGSHVIFEHLNWDVKRGERWALHGRNGSGKSALLGLVCADNPQSYACNISLFGRRRGTGESIWDIKRRIGYVSPEMHRAYLKDLPAIEIVASGFHDSIGLYVRPRPEQMGICKEWMRVFGIEELAERTFMTLSSGEQRLVLLARAFVKDPELLILDEPLHGLDTVRREQVREIINAFCMRPDKTLIMVTHYANELPLCITHHKSM